GKRVTGYAPAVLAAFASYNWPGNLRELRNVVERAVILASGHTIELVDLPDEFRTANPPELAVGARVTIDALETEHIRRVLGGTPRRACGTRFRPAFRAKPLKRRGVSRKREPPLSGVSTTS